MTPKKQVVFTDVDGTLLDSKYSFQATQPTIKQLQALDVAVVLVSSKTRVELEHYRLKLGITDPFISENGAAIFLPKSYFQTVPAAKQTSQYDIIELGIPYPQLREKLGAAREKAGCRVVGFGDLSPSEVAAETGLSVELAALAKQREYTEPVCLACGHEAKERFFGVAADEGLFFVKGDRFYHIVGAHDKGLAVLVLKCLYESKFGALESFGVGNGPNDQSMLRIVDHPFFIAEPAARGLVWEQIIAAAAEGR
jgi:mannosyl-3-phosphoglycerate phosphatase